MKITRGGCGGGLFNVGATRMKSRAFTVWFMFATSPGAQTTSNEIQTRHMDTANTTLACNSPKSNNPFHPGNYDPVL